MLAEGYAEYIAAVIREHRHLTRPEMLAMVRDTSAGSLAAIVSLLPFVGVELDAIELPTAYDVAPWIGIGVIGGYSLFANREAGLSPPQNAVMSGGGAADRSL